MTVHPKLSSTGQVKGSVVSSEISLPTNDHGSIELVIHEHQARGNGTYSYCGELQVRDHHEDPA